MPEIAQKEVKTSGDCICLSMTPHYSILLSPSFPLVFGRSPWLAPDDIFTSLTGLFFEWTLTPLVSQSSQHKLEQAVRSNGKLVIAAAEQQGHVLVATDEWGVSDC